MKTPYRMPWPSCYLLAGLLCVAPAAAQKYPEKNIRVVVPFPTGASQILGLLVAEKLGAAFGHGAYADFRPGAGGTIGTEIAAKAAPDGYTLLLAGASFAIAPSIYKTLSYAPVRDFQPIAQIGNVPNVMVIHPSVPAKSVKELVALAKTAPRKLSYGSGGVGSSNHLASELFKSIAKVDLVHVPYKGASIALTHILSGEVDLVTVTVPATIPFINSGRMRGLAVLATKRQQHIPNVPTSAESGYPDLIMETWYGVVAPTGVRADIVERLNSELLKIMHSPEVAKNLAKVGIDVVTGTPAEFHAFIKAENEKWVRVIREAKIRVE